MSLPCLIILCVVLGACSATVADGRAGAGTAPAGAPARAAGSGAGSEYDGVVLATATAATTDLPATWTIDPGTVIRPASPMLFGVNQAWLPQEHLMAGGPDGMPRPDFLALAAGVPLPLNRMAGSDSAHFRWKQAIGPMAGRTAFPDEFKASRVRALGPIEWVRTVGMIDPSAAYTWTFNCLEEEPADHADLAEFLTGTPGENRNGGEDWAARRVALGRTDPVPVAIWEIGNEVDHGGSHAKRFPDAAAYADYAARTIAAVRAVQPKASFAVLAATGPWSWKEHHTGDWKDWHRTVLRAVGKDVDWLVFHPYYCGLPIAEIERYLDVLRDDCRTLVPGHPIRIYVSEHARWPAMEPGKRWQLNWSQTHDLSGCLATGHFLIRILQRPEIGAAAYHALMAGPWGLFYDHDFVAGKDTALWRTGMADVLAAFRPVHGGEVLSGRLEGLRTAANDDAATCAAVAVRTATGLTLVLVNREPSAARRLTLAIPGAWRIIGGVGLSAPTLATANGVDGRRIAVSPIPAEAGPLRTWTLPARHLAVLNLERLP